MSFTPFTYEQHLNFLLDTLRVKLPNVDLSTGSFWQIWAQGQSRGLAGVTSALNYTLRQILPDRAVTLDLDHHAAVYDLPRNQPQRARGKVIGTATQTFDPASYLPDLHLHLEDLAGRIYDIDDLETFHVPFAGTFELCVTSREPGALTNQVTDTPLTFVSENSPFTVPTELDPQVRVLPPGLTGGTDLETDAELQTRIVTTLSAGRLKDSHSDYLAWALSTPTFIENDERHDIAQVWVYQDQLVRNRVYVLPLIAPPERIGPAGFCQMVFNTVDQSLPVTVDHIVPVITAEGIDVQLKVEPKSHARWDWYGTKLVEADALISTDRVIKLYDVDSVNPAIKWGGADGLRPGMRVLINGEQREIGHVDLGDRIITLTEDLSTIPDDRIAVYPGGPATEPVQEAIRQLFRVVTPLHKAAVQDQSPQNVLASAITDAVMELPVVHDVKVEHPEDLLDKTLLEVEAYRQGMLAYLAVPGDLSVIPMTDD